MELLELKIKKIERKKKKKTQRERHAESQWSRGNGENHPSFYRKCIANWWLLKNKQGQRKKEWRPNPPTPPSNPPGPNTWKGWRWLRRRRVEPVNHTLNWCDWVAQPSDLTASVSIYKTDCKPQRLYGVHIVDQSRYLSRIIRLQPPVGRHFPETACIDKQENAVDCMLSVYAMAGAEKLRTWNWTSSSRPLWQIVRISN